jgi:hypothetical protein
VTMHPIFQALLAPFTPKKSAIITSHVYPPIPTRDHDWCAYRDGDEERSSRYGWGATEQEAIADLIDMETSGYND